MGLSKVLNMITSLVAVLAPGLKNGASTHGVKELREMIKGVLTVAVYLIGKFKDGVQFTDFTEFYTHLSTDAEFKKVLEDAYTGYKLVPEEIKDIDAGEGLEVVGDIVEFVPQITGALAAPKDAPKA